MQHRGPQSLRCAVVLHGSIAFRSACILGVGIASAGCASEPKLGAGLPPMMLVGAPAATTELAKGDPAQDDIVRKSMAAKVLAARALELVTGAKPDPARLSELD